MLKFSRLRFSREEITKGHIGKSLFFLSVPLIGANIFQVAHQLIDTFWLGQVGIEALAAIAYALPITFLAFSLGGGMASAGAVFIGQYRGAKNQRGIDFSASQTTSFLAMEGILVALVGFFSAPLILKLLGASETLFPLALSYLQTVFLGMVFMYAFPMSRNFLRGVGMASGAMYVGLFAVALNLILDPLLIFGWGVFPRLEVQGAALATVLSRAVAGLAGMAILMKSSKVDINISLQYLKPNPYFFKRLAKLGFPVVGEMSARPIGIAAILPIISSFGTEALAAYGIGARILTLVFMAAMGVAQAVNTMVAQNLGAGLFSRARDAAKKAAVFSFTLFFFLGLIIFWQADFLVGIFAKDAEVRAIGTQFLQIVSFSFPLLALMRVFTAAFRGGGATLAAMTVSFSSIFLFLVPLVVLFSKAFGQAGVWWAFFVSYSIGGVFSLFWFSFGKWQKRLVDKDS